MQPPSRAIALPPTIWQGQMKAGANAAGNEHSAYGAHAGYASGAMYSAHAAYGARPARHRRPLSQRIVLEALLMTVMSVLALAAMVAITNRGMSLAGETTFSYGIDADKDPVQRPAEPFRTSMNYDSARVTFTSDTYYSISARVEGVMPYSDEISPAIPYDLLLSWGKLAEPGIAGSLTWQQSNRRGQVSGELGPMTAANVSSDYVVAHVSNNHIVPANNTIRQALATIKPGDIVRIDGRLVDVRIALDNRILTVSTSKSRTDQGDGACEIIYAEHVKVNQQTY